MPSSMPIERIFSTNVEDSLALFWRSSILINGCFSLSSTIFLATTSPSPSIALNGGIKLPSSSMTKS